MPDRYPRLNAFQLTNILHKHGFELVSQRGSHQKWKSGISGKTVIVPYHKGKNLPLGTIKSIILGSGIPQSEFK